MLEIKTFKPLNHCVKVKTLDLSKRLWLLLTKAGLIQMHMYV